MNKQFEQVKEFHKACGVEMPDMPTKLANSAYGWGAYSSESIEQISKYMKENSISDPLDQVTARVSYMLEEISEFMNAKTIEDQADALIDLMYFALGTFTLMGVKPEAIFDIVQAANMGKVVDGKVIRDEQGKIRKPDGWKENFAPEKKIRREIARQQLEGTELDTLYID